MRRFRGARVGGDAATEQRRSVHRRQFVGNERYRIQRGCRRLSVTAVVVGAWNPQITAIHQIPAAAGFIPAAVASKPANASTDIPTYDPLADGVDGACDFRGRYDPIKHQGSSPSVGDIVAVTNPTRLHL